MRKKGSVPRLVSRRDFLRLAAATAGAAAVGGTMSGCSEGGSENVRLMVWSPSLDQAKDSGEWLQTCCNRFAELHPEWNITYVYGVVDETAAGTTISQDTEASADVFMFTNDVLTNLIDAGAMAKFGGIYADEIKATNSEALLESLTGTTTSTACPSPPTPGSCTTTRASLPRRTSRAWTPCWPKG